MKQILNYFIYHYFIFIYLIIIFIYLIIIYFILIILFILILAKKIPETEPIRSANRLFKIITIAQNLKIKAFSSLEKLDIAEKMTKS